MGDVFNEDVDGIMEEMDSDLDMSADALDYNYDIINLKEVANPYHETIVNLLTIFNKNNPDDDYDEERKFNPEKILQSPTLLAVEIQIWMNLD